MDMIRYCKEKFLYAMNYNWITEQDIKNKINNPDFDHSTKEVQDWRDYVNPCFKNIWHELSEETRAILFFIAECDAFSEEWE